MNLILLFENDYFKPDMVCLTGRRRRHVDQVHRASVGDRLRVGQLNGQLGTGTITELTDQKLVMKVCCDQTAPSPSCVELVLALPRPKVLKRTLITATTLGIKRIALINSWRVEKSFWQTPLLAQERIREFLVEGLEQCCDTVLPQVDCYPLFKPYAEDVLPGQLVGKQGVVAHPHVEAPHTAPASNRYVLAIGPEGGFIPYEVNLLLDQGMVPLVLGSRILKVEAAMTSAVARLSPF
ncbi:16S rRNA (uracil(1498)-N(3))-methyltransferase [uncultured Desulfuromonas sp.]|uniref:16S rRNA (uracil(1498)-N(3))-methyltransferase n=1 Tax=uncultured Desulfuromonas sp. TaxID=181013 RepID=UPI002AAB62FF|nr:16S rRNA (uracil(1498)-N(3))-methyltransferase [uncultured Desulfuromonas sp.]